MQQSNYSTARTFQLVVMLLALFVCFFRLGMPSLIVFDESRLAVSALEMLQSKDYWIVTFGGEPDLWSVKPPLMIWLQVISMKIFGVNEFATRFPAALSGFLTIMLVFQFCSKEMKNSGLGFLACCILLSIPGFYGKHVVRSGDYDSLLILFLTLQAFLFYKYYQLRSAKYLWILAACIFLAVLTKSIAGLFFIPGFILFVIWKKKWWFFQSSQVYLAISCTIALISSYYLYRESLAEGYLQKVWENEWGGRYTISQEENSGPIWYYLKSLIRFQCSYWIWFLIFLIVPKWSIIEKAADKEWLKLSLVIITSFLFILSVSATKMPWYFAPAFPMLSILLAVIIQFLYNRISTADFPPFTKSKRFFYTLIFIIPILMTIDGIILAPSRKLNKHDLTFGDFSEQIDNYNGYRVLVDAYHAHIDFHVSKLRFQRRPIGRISTTDHFPKGTLVAAGEKKYHDFLNENYQLKTIEENRNYKLYEVLGPR